MLCISFSDVTVVSSASNESKESETTLTDTHKDTSATDDLQDSVSVEEFDYSTIETYSNNIEKLLSDEGDNQNSSNDDNQSIFDPKTSRTKIRVKSALGDREHVGQLGIRNDVYFHRVFSSLRSSTRATQRSDFTIRANLPLGMALNTSRRPKTPSETRAAENTMINTVLEAKHVNRTSNNGLVHNPLGGKPDSTLYFTGTNKTFMPNTAWSRHMDTQNTQTGPGQVRPPHHRNQSSFN